MKSKWLILVGVGAAVWYFLAKSAPTGGFGGPLGGSVGNFEGGAVGDSVGSVEVGNQVKATL